MCRIVFDFLFIKKCLYIYIIYLLCLSFFRFIDWFVVCVCVFVWFLLWQVFHFWKTNIILCLHLFHDLWNCFFLLSLVNFCFMFVLKNKWIFFFWNMCIEFCFYVEIKVSISNLVWLYFETFYGSFRFQVSKLKQPIQSSRTSQMQWNLHLLQKL